MSARDDAIKALAKVADDVKIESLIPGNRIRNQGVVDSIAQELLDNGRIREPLILAYDLKSGLMRLIEGNHRLAAARKAGLSYVPVRVVREYVGEGSFGATKIPTGFSGKPNGYVPTVIDILGQSAVRRRPS